MSDNSKIEWTDATWNPIVGCSIVSPGCTNCYAMRQADRIRRMQKDPPSSHYFGTTKIVNGNAVWTGKVALAPDRILTAPLRRRKPTTYFVNSMGDLFHESVPDKWIDRIFAIMLSAPQHTFQVLTKRAKRMRKYCSCNETMGRIIGAHAELAHKSICGIRAEHISDGIGGFQLINVWLGVSAEDQKRADERIPDLIETPAAVRFVSAEPMLGPIDLRRWLATANVMCKKCGASFWLHDANPCKHAGNGGWTLACPNCGDCKCVPTQEDRGDPVTWAPPASWKLKVVGRFDRVHPTISVKSGLDWVICGGESGHSARPMQPEWAMSLRDQCREATVSFFMKQMENGGKLTSEISSFPADLQIRQFPK